MRAVCVIAVTLFTLCALACGGAGKRSYTPVEADALAEEWSKNPSAAVKKYQNNGVELRGKLNRVDANVSGQTYIKVRGQNEANEESHIFVVDAKAKEGLQKCTVAKPIVVRARAEGSTYSRPWLVADEIRPGN